MIKCALVVLGCFTVAGIAQTIFYKSAISALFASPLDMGYKWRGKQLFGDNKTWKGVVVLVPVTTWCFVLAGWVCQNTSWGQDVWPLSTLQWAGLGLIASLGYVLGELPNSFIKRRLDIEPGGTAPGKWRRVFVVWDQLDSLVMGMLFIALSVPTTWVFHLTCVLIGATVHWLFNVLFYLLDLKKEAR